LADTKNVLMTKPDIKLFREGKKLKVTLTGTAVWPKLNTVDVFQPMRNGKPNGAEKRRYITGLTNDETWLANVEAMFKSILSKDLPDSPNAKPPIKTSKKTGAQYVEMASGEQFRPPVFDAQNNKVPPSVIIGGGSRLRIQCTVNVYDGFGGGINLYIDSVQLLKLEQNERTSPFEKEEEGYSYGGSNSSGEDEETPDHNSDTGEGDDGYNF
jgi:hypothetical protein